MFCFVFDRVENIVRKGENTCIFSYSYNVFKGFFSQGCNKSGIFDKGAMKLRISETKQSPDSSMHLPVWTKGGHH